MEIKPTPYKRQIFVCTHNAHGEKASCGDNNGEEVFHQLREYAKSKKLHPMIRVAQAKCLGQCEKGVNVMIYPDNQWYFGVRCEDVTDIAKKHIV